MNGKWRVATFMKSCDFYEMLRLIWKVVTFMKSCDFYEKLWLLWKVVTFMKGDDLSERLWLFQRFVTFPVRHNKNLFAPPFVFYKLRGFLSFYNRILSVLYCRCVVRWHRSFWYLYSGDWDHFTLGGHIPNQTSDTRRE